MRKDEFAESRASRGQAETVTDTVRMDGGAARGVHDRVSDSLRRAHPAEADRLARQLQG